MTQDMNTISRYTKRAVRQMASQSVRHFVIKVRNQRTVSPSASNSQFHPYGLRVSPQPAGAFLQGNSRFAPAKLPHRSEETPSLLASFCRYAAIVLLMMVLGVSGAWAQTDYSGYYYIANNNTNAYVRDAATNWYMVPASNGGDETISATAWQWNNSEDTPFVTTYQANKYNNSIWKIEKSGDYYYIIHYDSGKYLTYNNPVYTKRKAFHLQDTPDGDNSLFSFTVNGSTYNINRKDLTSGNYWLNPSAGNKPSYYGQTADTKEPEVAGLLGLYNSNSDAGSKWILEEVTPSFEFTSDDKIKITYYPEETATIYYTIDNTDPTASTSRKTYTEPFTPDDDLTIVRAIAIRTSDSHQTPEATFTPPVLPGSNHPYLIQNLECTDFYMIPGDYDGSISQNRITTTSLDRPSMQWCFKAAGITDGGQFYYLQNVETGEYASYQRTTGDVVCMYDADTFTADADKSKYKFCIRYYDAASPAGYYIKPMNIVGNNGNPYEGGLFKSNGNNSTSNCWLTEPSNAAARWNFIPIFDNRMPADANMPPFDIYDSNSTCATYYVISNASATTYSIIPQTTPTGYATTAPTTESGDACKWYFKEAGSDAWLTYYYIVNASSGQYLYFTGNIETTNNDNAFVTQDFTDSDTEGRYQFAIAKTTTSGVYYIVPKPIRYLNNANYSLVWRDGTKALKTQGQRAADERKWTFNHTTFQCKAPAIEYDEVQGKVTMTCPTGGAKIYYVRYTDDTGAAPDLTDDTIKETLMLYDGTPVSMVGYTYIKAIAARSYDNGSDQSSVTTYGPIDVFKCVKPVISYDSENNKVTITSATENARIYYVIGDGDIDASGEGSPNGVSFSVGEEPTIKAVAVLPGTPSSISDVATCAVISSWLSSYALDGYYILTNNFTSSEPIGTETNPFTGTIDGGYNPITLTHPLVGVAQNATIKNVIVGSATISTSGNAGAIANKATGTTRIYNCGVLGGSVSGGTNVGGLVGLIEANSSVRVVNCFNYANVSGSGYAAGIVGKNEGTVGDVRIAMCMMYGNVSNATNISPVYTGNHTDNVKNFTEYNYYLYSNKKDDQGNRIEKIPYTAYNDQLAIDKEEYLTRFPFYRHILNTHREMAAYFLFSDHAEEHVSEIGHWVLKTDVADYPIIEEWEKNTHKITQDIANNLPTTSADYGGKKLTSMGTNGELNVTVKIGGSTYSNIMLPITDMDTLRYDFTYGKVVLPYVNEFSGWTRDYRKICTGWKITSVGSNTSSSVTNYNFADRDNPQKDIYDSNNPYVFAQGGNYIVPYGVTAITIEAHFANAFYLSDPAYDMGYDTSYGSATELGGSVPSTYHGQTVYTSLTTLVNALATTENPHDQAIVLVGNFHYNRHAFSDMTIFDTGKAVTIMSVDEDCNQEPDYGWYSYMNDSRPAVPPLRFDFVPNIPMGMSSHVTGSTIFPGVSIWKVRGWFELTETCVSIMHQCEIDSGSFSDSDDGHGNNRWIANSGYFTQIVRSYNDACTKLSYIQIGGNAYVKELYPGNHSTKTFTNTAVPINVTGGEIEECCMTGYHVGGKLKGDNIYFWCAGGRIHKFLGAYMETPESSTSGGAVNMNAKVDHARIGRFFGGGTTSTARITGDINVTINNSLVDFYCGGPEFGDMTSTKTVTTNATGTTFRKYYGAGFGGTSLTYVFVSENSGLAIKDLTTNGGKTIFPQAFTFYTENRLSPNGTYGICTAYKFEYIINSTGNKLVPRWYVGRARFSLATAGNVVNNLTNCIFDGDFYGAGCQGKVAGTVASTLTGCTVSGSAYGGGYKAENNAVSVWPTDQPTYSYYHCEKGLFSGFGTVSPDDWEWEQGTSTNETCNKDTQKLYTQSSITMSDLGNVTGAISLTINGGSVTGNVFGGGNESRSLNDTSVTIRNGASIGNNVFGGGNLADVSGSTTVNIQE